MKSLAMKSVSELPARDIRGIIFDVDDTITNEHRLSPAAYEKICALHDAGFKLIAATGRPLGYAQVMLTQWPIDAAIGENGAGAYLRHGREFRFQKDPEFCWTPSRDSVRQSILSAFPFVAESQDSSLRMLDISLDIAEYASLNEEQISQLEERLRASDFFLVRSSVHLHVAPSTCSKAKMAAEILEHFKEDSNAWVAIGDSLNDESMFAFFQHSVGVANISRYLPSMHSTPRYLCSKARADGFVELASHILSQHSSSSNHA